MGRAIHRLSAKSVASAKTGYHADGGGLYLLVSATGAASWVFRFRRNGRLREMGLGSAQTYTLAEARQRATVQRKVLAEGLDPIDHRNATRTRVARTWGEAVADFIAAKSAEWKNDAQAHQWRQSLTDHGPDAALPVEAIDTALVLKLLRGMWSEKTETATRLRGRIERIWSAEKVAGTVQGENPARWRGHLDALLPKPAKVRKVKHHPALHYSAMPAFWPVLLARDGIARRALRFTVLTAARTGEVTLATWAEFDLAGKVWNRPAEHMKSGKAHSIPLTPAALACLEGLPRDKPPFALSENTMLFLLQKDLGQPAATVHGFRSTFSDWAHDTTDFPGHVIEMSLAHAIRNKAEAAYRRGDLMAKRRELMDAWAAWCGA